jgi:transcriptional regulator with XRE-family HTH domain
MSKQEEQERFAALVLKLRTQRQLSQHGFALLFGKTNSTIHKWEHCADPGNPKAVDPDEIAVSSWEKLAELEGCSVEELRQQIKGVAELPPKSIAAKLKSAIVLLQNIEIDCSPEVVLVDQPLSVLKMAEANWKEIARLLILEMQRLNLEGDVYNFAHTIGIPSEKLASLLLGQPIDPDLLTITAIASRVSSTNYDEWQRLFGFDPNIETQPEQTRNGSGKKEED